MQSSKLVRWKTVRTARWPFLSITEIPCTIISVSRKELISRALVRAHLQGRRLQKTARESSPGNLPWLFYGRYLPRLVRIREQRRGMSSVITGLVDFYTFMGNLSLLLLLVTGQRLWNFSQILTDIVGHWKLE